MFMLVIHVDAHASNTCWCSCYVLLYIERVVMPHYFCCKSNLRCRRSRVMVYMRRVHREWRNLISFGGLVWIIFFVFCIVFVFALRLFLVPNIAGVSGLSILDCPFGFHESLFIIYAINSSAPYDYGYHRTTSFRGPVGTIEYSS